MSDLQWMAVGVRPTEYGWYWMDHDTLSFNWERLVLVEDWTGDGMRVSGKSMSMPYSEAYGTITTHSWFDAARFAGPIAPPSAAPTTPRPPA